MAASTQIPSANEATSSGNLDRLTELVANLKAGNQEFLAISRKATAKAVEMGRWLAEAKEIVKLTKANWTDWFAAKHHELGFSKKTEERWRKLYDHSLKDPEIVCLELCDAYEAAGMGVSGESNQKEEVEAPACVASSENKGIGPVPSEDDKQDMAEAGRTQEVPAKTFDFDEELGELLVPVESFEDWLEILDVGADTASSIKTRFQGNGLSVKPLTHDLGDPKVNRPSNHQLESKKEASDAA